MTTTKQAWNELVDRDADDAVQIIKSQYPHLNVVKTYIECYGIINQTERDSNRVRVFYNCGNKVVFAPYIG